MASAAAALAGASRMRVPDDEQEDRAGSTYLASSSERVRLGPAPRAEMGPPHGGGAALPARDGCGADDRVRHFASEAAWRAVKRPLGMR